jgi:peptide/nickel transport system substrate-binding protein
MGGVRRILILALAISWGLTLGLSDDARGKEKVLVIGDPSPINMLDAALANSSQEILLIRNIYQGLLRYKFSSTEIVGDLAKSWTVSKDGLVYTFLLRENVLFHKGFGKVTAQDVKFSFDRIIDPESRSRYRGEWKEEVKEVKVIDDHKIEFHLIRPSHVFSHRCVGPRPLGIVSKKAVEKYGKDFTRNPVGSGPFVFQSLSREQVVLTAHREYWEGPPGIDKVIYKVILDPDTLNLATEKGDVDLMWISPRDKDVLNRFQAAGLKIAVIERGLWHQLILNPRLKPFADVRVRKAIAHAIDREAINQHLMNGTAEKLNSLIPKGYFGHTEKGLPHYEYDPRKAKELLAEAGYRNGFDVTMDTYQSPNYLPLTVAIQGQLDRVGIKVKVATMDQAAWLKKVSSGSTEMSLLLTSRTPDADVPLTQFYHSSGFSPGLNVARYDKLDKEINEARGEVDSNKRLKIYQAIQKKLMEDLPAIPLFMMPFPSPHRADLRGFPEQDPVYGFDFYRLYYEEKK